MIVLKNKMGMTKSLYVQALKTTQLMTLRHY